MDIMVDKKTLGKRPADLDIDKKIIDILTESHDELRKVFFEALTKNDFKKAEAVLANAVSIQNHIKLQYADWLTFRVFYEYLSGASIYTGGVEIANFLADATVATMKTEGA